MIRIYEDWFCKKGETYRLEREAEVQRVRRLMTQPLGSSYEPTRTSQRVARVEVCTLELDHHHHHTTFQIWHGSGLLGKTA